MPYTVTVSTGDVADKAASIQQTAGEIESLLSVLNAQMQDLAGTWTGPAAAPAPKPAFHDLDHGRKWPS